jgi:hypothetical protein
MRLGERREIFIALPVTVASISLNSSKALRGDVFFIPKISNILFLYYSLFSPAEHSAYTGLDAILVSLL